MAAIGSYSCGVALPVSHTGDLKKLASESEKVIGKYSKGAHCLPTKKGFHVSIAEFSAPTLATANKINGLIANTLRGFREFTIQRYQKQAELFTGPKKDFVVLPVKVKDAKKNGQHKVLSEMSQKIQTLIRANGGTVLFPNFRPHITVGKVTPKGVSGNVRLPEAKKKMTLEINPKKPIVFKPFLVK